MMYHIVGVVAGWATIGLSPVILRALGLPAVWRRLGVVMAAAMVAMTPVIGVPLPVQILEGVSASGLVCLMMLLGSTLPFKGSVEKKGEDE